jgi:hypothetical protein
MGWPDQVTPAARGADENTKFSEKFPQEMRAPERGKTGR